MASSVARQQRPPPPPSSSSTTSLNDYSKSEQQVSQQYNNNNNTTSNQHHHKDRNSSNSNSNSSSLMSSNTEPLNFRRQQSLPTQHVNHHQHHQQPPSRNDRVLKPPHSSSSSSTSSSAKQQQDNSSSSSNSNSNSNSNSSSSRHQGPPSPLQPAFTMSSSSTTTTSSSKSRPQPSFSQQQQPPLSPASPTGSFTSITSTNTNAASPSATTLMLPVSGLGGLRQRVAIHAASASTHSTRSHTTVSSSRHSRSNTADSSISSDNTHNNNNNLSNNSSNNSIPQSSSSSNNNNNLTRRPSLEPRRSNHSLSDANSTNSASTGTTRPPLGYSGLGSSVEKNSSSNYKSSFVYNSSNNTNNTKEFRSLPFPGQPSPTKEDFPPLAKQQSSNTGFSSFLDTSASVDRHGNDDDDDDAPLASKPIQKTDGSGGSTLLGSNTLNLGDSVLLSGDKKTSNSSSNDKLTSSSGNLPGLPQLSLSLDLGLDLGSSDWGDLFRKRSSIESARKEPLGDTAESFESSLAAKPSASTQPPPTATTIATEITASPTEETSASPSSEPPLPQVQSPSSLSHQDVPETPASIVSAHAEPKGSMDTTTVDLHMDDDISRGGEGGGTEEGGGDNFPESVLLESSQIKESFDLPTDVSEDGSRSRDNSISLRRVRPGHSRGGSESSKSIKIFNTDDHVDSNPPPPVPALNFSRQSNDDSLNSDGSRVSSDASTVMIQTSSSQKKSSESVKSSSPPPRSSSANSGIVTGVSAAVKERSPSPKSSEDSDQSSSQKQSQSQKSSSPSASPSSSADKKPTSTEPSQKLGPSINLKESSSSSSSSKQPSKPSTSSSSTSPPSLPKSSKTPSSSSTSSNPTQALSSSSSTPNPSRNSISRRPTTANSVAEAGNPVSFKSMAAVSALHRRKSDIQMDVPHSLSLSDLKSASGGATGVMSTPRGDDSSRRGHNDYQGRESSPAISTMSTISSDSYHRSTAAKYSSTSSSPIPGRNVASPVTPYSIHKNLPPTPDLIKKSASTTSYNDNKKGGFSAAANFRNNLFKLKNIKNRDSNYGNGRPSTADSTLRNLESSFSTPSSGALGNGSASGRFGMPDLTFKKASRNLSSLGFGQSPNGSSSIRPSSSNRNLRSGSYIDDQRHAAAKFKRESGVSSSETSVYNKFATTKTRSKPNVMSLNMDLTSSPITRGGGSSSGGIPSSSERNNTSSSLSSSASQLSKAPSSSGKSISSSVSDDSISISGRGSAVIKELESTSIASAQVVKSGVSTMMPKKSHTTDSVSQRLPGASLPRQGSSTTDLLTHSSTHMSSLSISDALKDRGKDAGLNAVSPADSNASSSGASFDDANDYGVIGDSTKNALQLETSVEASSSTSSLAAAIAATELPTTPNSHDSERSTSTVKPESNESPITQERRDSDEQDEDSGVSEANTVMNTPNTDSISNNDFSPGKSPQSQRHESSTASSFADSSTDGSPGAVDANQSPKNSDDEASSQDRTSGTRARNDESLKTSISSDMDYLAVWLKIEECLNSYTEFLRADRDDRAGIMINDILVILKKDNLPVPSDKNLAQSQREVLFRWINILLEDLKGTPVNRSACLEGIAAIFESNHLSATSIENNPELEEQFRDILISTISFAIDKLNEKAIFTNTLMWAGRMLAVAFFRIEGVAIKLLRLLPPVKRHDLRRILEEASIDPEKVPPPPTGDFPQHLLNSLTYKDLSSYSKMLSPLTIGGVGDDIWLIQSKEHNIEMNGNWLIRWTASDSDLPFSFYRNYHRQLAKYLGDRDCTDRDEDTSLSDWMLPTSYVINAPGYLFLAASLLEKLDGLVHRKLRSVTTQGPNSASFSTTDSATISMGAKPKVLEIANRRVVSTVIDIAGGPIRMVPENAADCLSRRQVFGNMLKVWIRAMIKRTSLWDARGVFVLLDFIESVIYTLCASPKTTGAEGEEEEVEERRPYAETLEMLDTPLILTCVKMILDKADNTVCIMRAIAFIYSQFEVFTANTDGRETLCVETLLDVETFIRLFLFWNASVRGYFLRLLVWRVSRLGTAMDGRPMTIRDPKIVTTLHLLSVRLEGIRKRHDEIDPLDEMVDTLGAALAEGGHHFNAKRATICSTRGVSDKPWTVEEIPQVPTIDPEYAMQLTNTSISSDKEEPLEEYPVEYNVNDDFVDPTGMYMPHQDRMNQDSNYIPGRRGVGKEMFKVVSWLKVQFGNAKKQGSRGSRNRLPSSRIDPYQFGQQNQLIQEEMDMDIPNDDLVKANGVAHYTSKHELQPIYIPKAQNNHRRMSEIEKQNKRRQEHAEREFNQAQERRPPERKSDRRRIERKPQPPELEPEPEPEPEAEAEAESESEKEAKKLASPAVQKEISSPNSTTPKSGRLKALPAINDSELKDVDATEDNDSEQDSSYVAQPKATGSPNFFKFEFEADNPRSDDFDAPTSAASGTTSPPAIESDATSIQSSTHVRKPSELPPASPRVSLRFSKRASILPKPALDLLGGSSDVPVPDLPEHFKGAQKLYDKHLHPYAIRGLREYEDALDEYDVWKSRVEEDENVMEGDLVPRLSVAWPTVFED